MSNQLEKLSEVTKVVADTGDFESIRAYHPVDATTNPSLVLKASMQPEYAHIVEAAVQYAKEHEKEDKKRMMTILIDKLSVLFGKAILEVVPGLVSTEVDARLSFDKEKMIEKCTRRRVSRRTVFSSRCDFSLPLNARSPVPGRAWRLRACWRPRASTAI
ncbi:hypothetical protein BLSTO_05384 [Blastocystis sp. subtype 1]